MERYFIATKESKYLKDYNEYTEKIETQRKFINKFFEEKEIDGNKYIVGGDGRVNIPFEEWNKSKITLRIEPTENNLNKFSRMLRTSDRYGLCAFRKNSNMAKQFAKQCIDEKIVVNLYSPRIGDYFNDLCYYGCKSQHFIYTDIFYIKVDSEGLKENDTPNGFTEIKASEYYKILEEFKDNK